MILYFIRLIFLFRCLEMGKKYLTVRKRRKGERKVAENNRISNKHIRCPPIFRKCGDEQQSMKSNYSYKGSQQFIRSSKPCDENSKQCDDQNSEQWDDKNSGRYHENSRQHDDENSAQRDDENSEQCDESSEQCDENNEQLDDENNEQLDDENSEQWDDENSEQCDKNLASSELPDCLSLCSKPPTIDLDPDCCRRSIVDLEQPNWLDTYTMELPDINSIGKDTELMTIHPVSDPFHYMSTPVLSAFGLIFEDTLQELRYSYMNLLQSIGSAGRWFMLPPDNINHSIHVCTYNVNSASAPVITLTIEIHHSHRWFLRHSTSVMTRDQHPVLLEVRHVLDPVGGSTRREYVPRRGGHLLCCCRGVMNCYRCLSLGVFVGSTSGMMTGLWGI